MIALHGLERSSQLCMIVVLATAIDKSQPDITSFPDSVQTHQTLTKSLAYLSAVPYC